MGMSPAEMAEALAAMRESGREVPPQTVTVEVKVRIQALAFPEQDGGYSVVVPALPGCITEAGSIEEVSANVVEAAEGWLASQHDRNRAEATRSVGG